VPHRRWVSLFVSVLGSSGMKAVLNFIRQEEGASLAEYGLLIALIAVVCVGAVTALGVAIDGTLTGAAGAI
jgi:pilus assembly protein Flp/PilA